jgi:hypothetical protein
LKENIVSTSGTKPIDVIPMYEMRPLFDQTKKEKLSEKVSNLRNFWGSCVNLLNDINSLQILQNMLEKIHPVEEGVKTMNSEMSYFHPPFPFTIHHIYPYSTTP